MSTLIQNNKTFSLGNITGSHDKLPVGNYSLQHSDRDGYFLVQQEDFKIPSKLYGDFSFIDRWIKSYLELENINHTDLSNINMKKRVDFILKEII